MNVYDNHAIGDRSAVTMKGRPFVLLGMNGNDDREKANAIAVTEGINRRSFGDGCSVERTCAKWGVSCPHPFACDATQRGLN
jgi:hypothetical protein